jgi:hypothetical protein
METLDNSCVLGYFIVGSTGILPVLTERQAGPALWIVAFLGIRRRQTKRNDGLGQVKIGARCSKRNTRYNPTAHPHQGD